MQITNHKIHSSTENSEEKAMPFLRLETATPTETEKTIVELKKQLEERDKEIEAMKKTMAKDLFLKNAVIKDG